MPPSEPGDGPQRGVGRSGSLQRAKTVRTNSGGVSLTNTRPPPRNLGGPSYFDPRDHVGRSSRERDREVWGLGAVLPARKGLPREEGGSGESADGRSIISVNLGGPRSDGGALSPRNDLSEVGDPFETIEVGAVTGIPTSISPGPVIFEDKVLESDDIEKHEQRKLGSGNSKDDNQHLDVPSLNPREQSMKSRRGSNATEDNRQLGGELAEDRSQWDAMEDDMIENMHVRNGWGRVRFVLREPLAEFLGMLVMIVLGVGSDCQVRISVGAAGTYSDQNWTWGFGVMSAIYIAGGKSGGHMNPALTVALAVFRGFPWRMVPRYVLANVLGAMVGAFIIYGNYLKAIHQYDPAKLVYGIDGGNASASLFVTVPNQSVAGTGIGFVQEVVASAILTIVVFALGDEDNAPPGAGLGALVIGFVVTAIGMGLGWISGYAINPARDFGPRVALWIMGYGTTVWTHDHWWWLVGPIIGPLTGSLAGGLLYDVCIYTGDGSPINYTSQEIANSLTPPRLHHMVPKAFRSRFSRAQQIANTQADAEAGYAGVRKLKRGEISAEGGGKVPTAKKDSPKWRWRLAKKGGKVRRDKSQVDATS